MKWLTVKLADIAIEMQPGFAKQPSQDGLGLPQLRTHNVSADGQINLSTIKTVVASENEIAKYSLQARDIIFNNTNSPALVGKTAFFEENGHFLFSNHMTRIRVREDVVDAKFISTYLHWIWMQGGFRNLVTQWVNQAAINRIQLSRLSISLPPISEQHRIVEILDQADALRRMRAEADAKSDRILPALFIKIFGDPSTWADAKTEPLGSLVNIQSGGTPSKKNPDYWDGDIPWVSPKDMKQDIIFDSIDHISQTAIEETNIKYVEPGAILIVVRGMILAHTIPIALAATRLTINQDMKALYPNCSDIDSTYLHAALKASSRKILSQVGTAGHGTRKFDTDELLKLPILIPSQEQLKKFQIAVTECRVSLAGISKTKEKLETLFNLLLQRAFSSELTAKWREAHIKELLAEMEEQAKILNLRDNGDYQQLSML